MRAQTIGEPSASRPSVASASESGSSSTRAQEKPPQPRSSNAHERPHSPRYARLTVLLEPFSQRTREWFLGAFAQPTAAQEQAWPAIASGEHVLICAPTGSGKTLAAFLWAIDRLGGQPEPDRAGGGTRLVYVSPLKALSYDIERNLRAPLKRIGADLKVAVR